MNAEQDRARAIFIEALEDRLVPSTLSIANASQRERDHGSRAVEVEVRLSAPTSSTVRVDYHTWPGPGTPSTPMKRRGGGAGALLRLRRHRLHGAVGRPDGRGTLLHWLPAGRRGVGAESHLRRGPLVVRQRGGT